MPSAVLDVPAPAAPAVSAASSGRRIIFNGEPGTRYKNTTGKALWQFVCDLKRTCGACLQYHMAIGPPWPLGIHYGCRCKQFRVDPWSAAPHAFVDFRSILADMSHSQQVAAIGAGNYALLKAKVVSWGEIVSRYHVRSLREVIALNKISLETALKAGVRLSVAKVAFTAVNTPAAEILRQDRAELTAKISAAGVSHDKLVEHIAKALTDRVTIVGPSGSAESMATIGTIVPLIGPGAATAAALAAAIGGWRPGKTVPPPKAPPAALAAPVSAAKPVPPFGPAAAAAAVAEPVPSAAVVEPTDQAFHSASTQIFGRVLTNQEVANLTGLPDGRTLAEGFDTGFGKHEIQLETLSSRAQANRIVRVENHRPVLIASSFHVEPAHQGQGLGADTFGRMIDQAQKLGIETIKTQAQRAPDSNGYYTWPRFGYDGPLDAIMRSGKTGAVISLPESLKGAKRVSDLMATKEGTEWWKTHGDTIDLTFDLRPGSKSRQIWDAYQAEKKALATASSSPTSPTPTSKPPTGPGRD
jgi:GNAT superfamily N-acetyltransferase